MRSTCWCLIQKHIMYFHLRRKGRECSCQATYCGNLYKKKSWYRYGIHRTQHIFKRRSLSSDKKVIQQDKEVKSLSTQLGITNHLRQMWEGLDRLEKMWELYMGYVLGRQLRILDWKESQGVILSLVGWMRKKIYRNSPKHDYRPLSNVCTVQRNPSIFLLLLLP